ncbi:MAG: ATP-binding cassette domain-containing protein [Candidatus Lokiarchaeota archaeon]|nr:ATP-binding cassette domain-containing protein [Candidatus Lokiarchaeota archaeon]
MHHYPDQLSGGDQQRFALIRVAVKEPEVLLSDEPTGELDSENKEKILNLITDLHKDHLSMTIIVVTHDPDFKIIADRVFFLRDGKISYILADKKLEEFKTQVSNQISVALINDSKNSISQKIKSEKIEE